MHTGTDFFLTDEINGKGIELDSYQGQFQLVAAMISKRGKISQIWVYLQTWLRKSVEHAIPMHVTLGDRLTARRVLWHFLQLMGGPPE